MTQALIRLDILSDPVCPWCLIGKSWLDRALEAAPDHPFAVEWHPFQLNPDMPREGMDRRAYLEAKFGGQEGAVKVYSRIMQAAEEAGVAIALDRMTRMPNTLDAHRLIHWAGLEGMQGRVVDGLFRAFFREGRDIGDPEVLADIATAAGMEREMVIRLLASEADAEDIRARDAHARARGVNGVPTFVIGDAHVLTGAQQPALWGQVIEELTRRHKASET
ncbi:MAG: DsbA family oxidoreductase [Rhodobacteraceae bacterium]|nr:DsbA family oxidoreductase [Paracoccaceae bacterium]